MDQYGFTEGRDFLPILGKNPNGGRPSKEYAISLDTAPWLTNDSALLIAAYRYSTSGGNLHKATHKPTWLWASEG
ncbi:antA/AntB antirepressor family protein [Vreelandella massiliensis]|uniref:antA/AntB antirepressor family protein n=1 Tax=Vreelandella massiliensis TaxID=1816686 RepID=UPI0009FB382E